ncbi:MAG: M10 family metallopeptidase C-terminal domain-containing protein [Pirellulales bacterium]|nr:M10 family metallopeptidase C-terminal domain-containing protein [Pirellulales bacterium]
MHRIAGFEALESRLLLSISPLPWSLLGGNAPKTADYVLPAASTGDVIAMDADVLLHGSDYQLLGAEVVGTGSALTIVTDGGTGDLLLNDAGSETVARAILSQRAEEGGALFEDVGRLYLVPAVDSSLADDDDPAEPGFQGTLELTVGFDDGFGSQQSVLSVDIQPGHSGSGENSVTINTETLDVLRLQHRLNHLGMRGDASGDVLDLTGTMDAETTSVLQLFQAVVDSQGTATPEEASGEISLHSATWLNDASAPRWEEYTPLGSATERYGTDWLAEIVDYGTTTVAGLAAAGIHVDTISTIDGYGSAALHAGGPGRLHQVGLDVDFTVPGDAQAGDGLGLNVASEQLLFDLVDAMHDKAADLGLTMTEVFLSNDDIIDAINAAIDPPLGSPAVAMAGAGLAAGLMQVGFAAPTVHSTVAASEADSMQLIVRKLRELGETLELIGDEAVTLTAGTEIPYVGDGLSDVVDLGQSMQDLANRLLGPAMVAAVDSPSGVALGDEAPVLVLLDGENPTEVRIPANGSTSIGDLITDIDAGLAAADYGDGQTLGDLLEAGQTTNANGDPVLSIATAESGVAGFLTLTTLRMTADDPGPAYGQPTLDLEFDVSFTLMQLDGTSDTETSIPVGPVAIELLVEPSATEDWPSTEDNVTLQDLADDLNEAFELAVPGGTNDHLGNDLFALVDDGGTSGDTSDDKLVVAARNPYITDVTINDLSASEEAALGFSDGQTAAESSMEATSKLGFEGVRAIAEPRFDSVGELMAVLADELGVTEEDLDWEYDAQTGAVLFNLALSESYEKQSELDFGDGLDLGPLGTLELTATADAAFEVGVDLDFRVGLYLGELGEGIEITGGTPLAELNGGAGVDILVAVTADNDGPEFGRPAANDTITLEINGGAGSGGSDHALSFNVASAEITDNFDLLDLVADMNDQLDDEGLGEAVEAAIYAERDLGGTIISRRITLLATDESVRTLDVLGGTLLGFSGAQGGNHYDLVVDDGGGTHYIDLDGAETVQDVIDAFNAATDSTLSIADDGLGLRVQSDGSVPLTISAAQTFDTTSLAGLGLGILGVSEDGDGTDDGILEGAPLHGRTLTDRVFLVEPAAGEQNVNLSLEVRAEEINLSAGLGLIALQVANVDTDDDVDTDPDPLRISLGLPLNLKDPGTGDNQDGRITLGELYDTLRSGDVGSVIHLSEAMSDFTADVSAALGLSADLFDGAYSCEIVATVGLATENDLGSLEFNVETSDCAAGFGQLGELSVEQVLQVIRDFLDQLQQSAQASVLSAEIPVIDTSLADIIDLADRVFDAVDQVISSVDLDAVRDARDVLDSAIANLPICTSCGSSDKQDLLDALQSLDGVLAGDLGRLPTRLISIAGELQRAASETIGTGPFDPIEQELVDALEDLETLVPSLNTLAERLESAVNEYLPSGVVFHFDVVDFDGNPGNGMQNAVVIGLTAGDDDLVAETFSPELPADSFGILDLGADVDLYAGGSISLGFGIDLTELTEGDPAEAPFVLVRDPDVADPSLVKTGLDLNAGFDSSFSAGVGFGSLDLVDADVELSLLAAEQETLTVGGGAVTLSATPLEEDSRFVIVYDGTDVLAAEEFEISGTTLTFVGGSPPANGTEVTVQYQTSTVPGTGTDRAADLNNRATVSINFDDPAFTITGNAIGAVPLVDLFDGSGPSLQIQANGMVVGALDAEFLNSRAENAVTLAVGLEHLLDPQLNIDTEALLSMFQDVEFDLRLIVEGVETLLQLLEDGLTSEVAANLPLIGGGLNTAGTFIGDLRTHVVEPFGDFLDSVGGTFEDVADSIAQWLYDQLNPLGIIGDTNGNSTPGELGDVIVELDADHFQFLVKLSGGDEVGVDFDSGLAGLPLEAEGGAHIGWDYDIDFGVGVDRLSGFYFVVNDPMATDKPEVELQVYAGLDVDNSGPDPVPTSLTLDLYALELSVTDNLDGTEPGTKFTGTLGLDVEGNTSNRLPLSDLGSRSFGEIFQIEFNTQVGVDLELAAALGADLPGVAADLTAGWEFSMSTGSKGQIEVVVGEPEVTFGNIRLELGGFLSQYIGPAIDVINDILEPFRPVLDLLTAEVPGVSQLSEMAGRGPVTMIDLVAMIYPEKGESIRKFVNVVSQIADVIEAIDDASSGGEVVISFGDLNFGGTHNDVDLRDSGWNTEDLDSVFDAAATGFQSLTSQMNDAGSMEMGQAVSSLTREPSSGGLGGLGIELAFLQPTNIFKFLIGQTADIITWDIPRFDFLFEWGQKFRITPVPPISVEIGFNLGAFIDLSVGYDTRGLQTGNFIDGFYFGDLANVSSGSDVDEFGFGMGVTLAALLDIGVASAGIEGEIRGDVYANWADTDNDGKMYLDEIANIVRQDGVECLFDIHGAVRAIVRLVWEVLFWSGSVDIIDVEIFSFSNEGLCPKFEAAHVADGTDGEDDRNVLPDGTTAAEGTLILHAGHFAGLRQQGSSTDTTEQYTVTQFAPGVYEVEGMGLTQSFSAVESIFFDGGTGNDVLDLIGLNGADEVPVPVTAYGGDGADVLEGGSQDDLLDGGAGADSLTGYSGADTLVGGGGNDTITGDTGDDSITGGDGDDRITGGDGNDTIEADSGNDWIEGQGGGDSISGGAGTDAIYGAFQGTPPDGAQADAADYLEGNANRDTIYGDDGDDTIYGGSGDDFIYGEEGSDILYGDSGHDWMEGGTGDDRMIDAGKGNDLLIGGPGKDVLLGNWGNDVIFGYYMGDNTSTDGEHIEGGPDDDYVCGTEGVDLIYGGTGEVDFGSGLGTGLDHVDPWTNTDVPVLAGGYVPSTCLEEPEYVQPDPVVIMGQKFEDLDGEGTWDADETPLGGWTIELYDDLGDFVASTVTADLDLDDDGSIDPITERGVYRFEDLDPGTYTVVEVLQGGHQQTAPDGGSHEVTLDSGETAEGLNFGNRPLARICGFKWDDIDRDGFHDPDEPGLGGVTVYLDINENGYLDTFDGVPLEPYQVTMEDDPDTPEDETGRYCFEDVTPGTYIVREVVPAGRYQTYPRATVVYYNVFEGGAGGEWSNNSIDGTPSGRKFLGQFGSEAVVLDLAGLPSHETVTVEFDLYVIRSWNGNQVIDLSGQRIGPDRWSLGVEGGATLVDTTLSNSDAPIGPYNQAYPDDYGVGDYPPRTGAAENNTLGYYYSGEYPMDSVYHLRYTFAHHEDYLKLNFAAMGIEADETWGLDNMVVIAGSDGHIVEVGPGDHVRDVDFGNSPPRGDITGQKFEDLNSNGRRDPGEVGLDGWTIELVDARTGSLVDTQVTQSDDVNHDGEIHPETEQGLYAFIGIDPGTYIVREVQQPGFEPTTSPAVTIFVSPDQPITIDFGNQPKSLDFGDAPDRPYPTFLESDGPRHLIVQRNPTLGRQIDAESDGLADGHATGDDLHQTDDEDGVVFAGDLVVGEPGVVQVVVTNADGVLNAWIDFNGDGDWLDKGEHVFQAVPLKVGTHTLSFNVPGDAPPGDTFARFRLSTQRQLSFVGPAPNGEVEDYRVTIEAPTAVVVGRHVFYNNSYFDGNLPQANSRDDEAIALDKQALLPGQTATFANYTSYARGINGIMVDLDGLDENVTLGPEDFEFRVGNDNDPDTWDRAPKPISVTVRPGAGVNGSDRVTVLWEDYAVLKQWLQVTVRANDRTRLAAPDVFYFGNAVAEAGNSTTDAKVNATDMLLARNNPRTFINPAGVDFPYDYNRDARVNATDMLLARNNQTHFLNALRLITVPAKHEAGDEAPVAKDDPDCLVYGYKWDDQDGNGTWDAGEPGLAGVTIYVDLNDNGQLDAGEPSTVTGDDDPDTAQDDTGFYCFGSLPGPSDGYVIREVVPDGWIQTFPVSRLLVHDIHRSMFDINRDTAATARRRITGQDVLGMSVSPDDGLLYALSLAKRELVTIDPPTGLATSVSTLDIEIQEGDIDFDPTTGALYGVRGNGNYLYKIDVGTGHASPIGQVAQIKDPSAMAFDQTGNLYVIDPQMGVLLRLDKSNAAIITSVSLSLSGLGTFAGMDFDPVTGRLYLVASGGSGSNPALFAVDVNSGNLGLVGYTRPDLSAMEFIPDPAHVVQPVPGQVSVRADFGNWQPTYLPDGSDEIHAAGRDDTIYGDNLVTDPTIISEGDADLIYGDDGKDSIYGQDKDDVLWGANETLDTAFTADDDLIDGGEDNDEVRQTVDSHQTLTNALLTGQGNDSLVDVEQATLAGGPDGNVIDASAFTAGPVTLIGEDGADEIYGGTGDDSLLGGPGDDVVLAGGDGDDTLVGGAGSDQLKGEDGDDVYQFETAVSTEVDEVSESAAATGGIDTLDFSTLSVSDGVSADLTALTIATHTHRQVVTTNPSLLENAFGGAGQDALAGNANDNWLVGGANDDKLKGLGGNDTLEGGAGDDDLDGGDDDDVYVFRTATTDELDTIFEAAGPTGGVDTVDFSALAAGDPVTVALFDTTLAQHTHRIVKSPTAEGVDNVIGTPGDDTLVDSNYDNLLTGGDGDDLYVFIDPVNPQNDVVEEAPAAGIDTLVFGLVSLDLTVDLTAAAPMAFDALRSISGPGTNFEHVLGGSGDDDIKGNGSDNSLYGGPGNDTLSGEAGADTLEGANGDDLLQGDAGDDLYVFTKATAMAETDTIAESAAPDGGTDTLDFSALAAGDRIDANLTDLVLTVQHTHRVVNSPDPSLLENVLGTPGIDVLVGNAAANRLEGREGADLLDGLDGDDQLLGGAGDDFYRFSPAAAAQNDTITELAGEGSDWLWFAPLAAADPVLVDLSAESEIASHTNRTVQVAAGTHAVNIEHVAGGPGADSITGSAVANILWGGEGDDQLDGGLGGDVLYGGLGSNTLRGGGGDDFYYFADGIAATDTLVEDSGVVTGGLAAGGGSDTLDFRNINGAVAFDLTLTSQVVNGILTVNLHDSSGPLADYFENILGTQLAGNQFVGNGADNILVGGPLVDLIDGGAGNDVLLGRDGADFLLGGGGHDIVLGGPGDDSQLLGEAGRDIIVGGTGSDTLDGGDGEDILADGTTLFGAGTEEETIAALGVIRDEWTLTSRTYEQRTANIAAGVGAGGAFRLAVGSTVFYDSDPDELTGGLDRDWFFRNLADDTVTDLDVDELAKAAKETRLESTELRERATTAYFELLAESRSRNHQDGNDGRHSDAIDDDLEYLVGRLTRHW